MSDQGYELWRRVERTDGSPDTGYLWMLWRVGPMGGENATWFDTEDEARGALAAAAPEATEGGVDDPDGVYKETT